MAGANRRWMKFWPQDWQRDPALRSCGIAARGLWMDMICIAHEGTPYGHVTINGKAATTRQIGIITGIGERDAVKLVAELEAAGVFSRTEDGTIFSRRMVRDNATAGEGATNIQKRWGEGEAVGKSRSSRLSEARRKGKHTEREWIALQDIFKDVCPRCNKPFKEHGGVVKDHIVPIYKGGSDAIENIQPLCQRCNASKGSDTTDFRPKEWHQTPSFLGIERLGSDGKTPTLDTESEAEKETPLRGAKKDPKSEPNGTRLPADWNPGDEGAEFARSQGLDPYAVFPRFRDYWVAKPGADGRKLDWLATWRNWCRKEAGDRNVTRFPDPRDARAGASPSNPQGRRVIPMSGMV